jgi:hypothetical protein
MENKMKNALTILLLMTLFTVNGCSPAVEAAPQPQVSPYAAPQETAPAFYPEVVQTAATKSYANSAFGLALQYPTNWYGPDEYISGETLRVAVGSDVIYPYGTDRTDQVSEVKNSYTIVIQLTKNDQAQNWQETTQLLAGLKDGESYSTARSTVIRVRQLGLGKFSGYEYISTLSETAQTEPVYMREAILSDGESAVLTVSGSPNNVKISQGANWRETYQMIDEENQAVFTQILESVKIK